MLDAAAFCASRMTLSIAGLLVTMSLKVRWPPCRCDALGVGFQRLDLQRVGDRRAAAGRARPA